MKNRTVQNNQKEYVERSFTFNNLQVFNDSEEYNIEGHAAVFGQRANIAGIFEEIIEPSAFNDCDLSDVSLFVNHIQSALPLARCKGGQGTMKVGIDDKGLFIKAKLDIQNNRDAQSLYSSIQRNDIDGMSFSFYIREQRWENLDSELPTRRITKIAKVSEVSAVTYPAYEGTDIASRSKKDLDKAIKEYSNSTSDIEMEKLRLEFLAKI